MLAGKELDNVLLYPNRQTAYSFFNLHEFVNLREHGLSGFCL